MLRKSIPGNHAAKTSDPKLFTLKSVPGLGLKGSPVWNRALGSEVDKWFWRQMALADPRSPIRWESSDMGSVPNTCRLLTLVVGHDPRLAGLWVGQNIKLLASSRQFC